MLKYFLIIILMLFSYIFPKEPPFLANNNQWAENILTSLTLKEKIGQLFVVAAASNFEQPTELLASSMLTAPYTMDEEYVSSLIKEYHVGGILFLYKSDPKTQMVLTKKFQQLATIPLLIAQDGEWGLSMRLDGDPDKVVRYPRNMTLGAITDENLIYQIGYEIGQQCAAIGVHLNCAPVIDVNNNPGNPVIHDRSFGDDPEHVAHLGALFAQGLQDAGIIACAKHFPGHGDTITDSHSELPVITHTKERLEAVELLPFRKLIDDGVGAIMTAHLAIPALDATPHQPSSMSYATITQKLKNDMNFQGLVITDGLGMQAITNHYKPGNLELEALLAGNDILLCPLDVPRAVKLIKKAVQSGRISQVDLDTRVLKILQAKAWAFEQQKKLKQTNTEEFLIRHEAYALQKKAYEQAITLVKKPHDLAFEKALVEQSCVIQIGTLINNIFLEELTQHTKNTHTYSAQFQDAELQSCLAATKNFDTVIIALSGITKNAQQQFGITNNTLALIDMLKKANKNVHGIIFGTPYCLPLLENADTIIMAYEDAPAAQKAAAKVLLGKIKATGKLPVNSFAQEKSPE